MAIGISRARLAIPHVNQNPRPPRIGNAHPLAARIAKNGGTTAPRRAAHSPIGPGLGNAKAVTPVKHAAPAVTQPTNPVAEATPGSTSAASVTPAASTASPNELFKIPSWTPASPGEPDPRDATYWANLAKLQFADTQEYQKNLAEESAGKSEYNLALQQAIRERGIQERQLGESAIKNNLSASGWLGRTQAEQTTNYAEERGAAARQQEGEQQAFAAARSALQQGFGVEAAALLAEAAGRRAELAGEETETGIPEVSGPGAPHYGPTTPVNQHPVGAKRWAAVLRNHGSNRKGKR